jgi:hypothetical protein
MPNSPWTETGSSISLVPTTTTIGSDPENVNYLSNQDKINLMAQYTAELAMKTSLDTLTSTWSVSSTFYDNAVAAISTALINAGAPANWATTWPDGTTSGPWPGIQTSLANLWAQVATQRTALQSVISNAQAAAAQTTAIAAAATDATNKMNAAITAVGLAPVVVSSLPTLPNATYPSGRLVWNTADGQLYRSTGSAWTPLTVSAPDISGTLTAAQIASVAASQVTGQLTSAQVASISAAQLTGQITGTQISNGSISTPQLAAGAVTAATIAANTITASQIAAGAITSTQIAAGTVTAANIAAGTIQASNIAAATITGDKIAANAITSTQIAAGTITAGQIAAGTITAGQIAAGAIGATQIAAGSIAASKLVVADLTNLAYNYDFSDGSNNWALGLCVCTPASEAVASGPNGHGGYVALLAGSSSSSCSNLNYVSCTQGQSYYGEAYINVYNLTSGSGFVWLAFFDSNKNLLTNPTGNVVITGGAWILSSVSAPAPANAAYVAIGSQGSNPVGSGGNISMGAFTLRRCNDASLIVDGSITASKIAAGAITASMITTGTLNAANVAVTNLNASNITTGTLSASKVLFADGTALTTASRVQTSMLHQTATATTSGAGNPGTAIAGLTCSVTAASTADTFNMFGALSGGQTAGTVGTTCNVNLYVDGNFNQSISVSYATLNGTQSNAFILSLTGLSAGTHTLTFYLQSSLSAATFQSYVGSTLLLQRVF